MSELTAEMRAALAAQLLKEVNDTANCFLSPIPKASRISCRRRGHRERLLLAQIRAEKLSPNRGTAPPDSGFLGLLGGVSINRTLAWAWRGGRAGECGDLKYRAGHLIL